MLAAHRTSLLLLAAVFAPCGSGAAQDPAIDLPHERVALRPEFASYVDQGLSLLAAGEHWQAAGSFREVVHRDGGSAIGYLGLALATVAYPRTAARYVWMAYGRRAAATPAERSIVAAYARCYVAEDRPQASAPRYDLTPDPERLEALRKALKQIAGNQAESSLAARIAALPRSPRLRFSSVGEIATQPRHPRFDFGSAPWQPSIAPGFDLLRGLGGRREFELYKGKPVLVVFFLGFG